MYASISVITVFKNGEHLLREKIENSLALASRYPDSEVILFSDGSTDQSESIIREYPSEKIRFLKSEHNDGKNKGLNKSANQSKGEFLVFTDLDSLVDVSAFHRLLEPFADPDIGGVCGQRKITKEESHVLKSSQNQYIAADSMIKFLEGRSGSITSNDGKLYAIRKRCFQDIACGVTDDLYCCLNVIKQGYRFVFAPDAKAYVKLPSRNSSHEISRRRRIVCRSLRGLYLHRDIFNVFKYGMYSVRLFVNKVVRRLLPFILLGLLLAGIFQALNNPLWWLPLAGFALAILLTSAGRYFFLGNLGTFLGVMDFLSGRQYVTWKPLKFGS